MPPKKKYSKEQIIDKAFAIAKKEGLNSITIRKVADKLGSSVAPIYVNFDDVDELTAAVIDKTFALSREILNEQNSGKPFKDIGLASIRFAKEYPVLFKDIIIGDNNYLKNYDQNLGKTLIEEMKKDSDLQDFSEAELEKILLKMRVIQTGLSIMVANGLFPGELEEKKEVELLDEMAEDIVYAARRREEGSK
jgi:AcrR family transcriptional regulator